MIFKHPCFQYHTGIIGFIYIETFITPPNTSKMPKNVLNEMKQLWNVNLAGVIHNKSERNSLVATTVVIVNGAIAMEVGKMEKIQIYRVTD